MTALTLSGKTYEIPALKLNTLIAGAALIERIDSASAEAAATMLAASAALRAREAGQNVDVPIRPFSQTVAVAEPILRLFELATAKTDIPLKADELLAELTLEDIPAMVSAYVDLAISSGIFPAPAIDEQVDAPNSDAVDAA